MLVYLYADLFGFFIPGHLVELLAGELAGIPLSQEIVLAYMIFMTIPALMVFLSVTLVAKTNRWINIIIGIVQLILVVPSVIDLPNYYFMFASSIETVLLILIIWTAWTWPKQEE
jgi:hypothetical protein